LRWLALQKYGKFPNRGDEAWHDLWGWGIRIITGLVANSPEQTEYPFGKGLGERIAHMESVAPQFHEPMLRQEMRGQLAAFLFDLRQPVYPQDAGDPMVVVGAETAGYDRGQQAAKRKRLRRSLLLDYPPVSEAITEGIALLRGEGWSLYRAGLGVVLVLGVTMPFAAPWTYHMRDGVREWALEADAARILRRRRTPR
jgi:hypothetical protein